MRRQRERERVWILALILSVGDGLAFVEKERFSFERPLSVQLWYMVGGL